MVHVRLVVGIGIVVAARRGRRALGFVLDQGVLGACRGRCQRG